MRTRENNRPSLQEQEQLLVETQLAFCGELAELGVLERVLGNYDLEGSPDPERFRVACAQEIAGRLMIRYYFLRDDVGKSPLPLGSTVRRKPGRWKQELASGVTKSDFDAVKKRVSQLEELRRNNQLPDLSDDSLCINQSESIDNNPEPGIRVLHGPTLVK